MRAKQEHRKGSHAAPETKSRSSGATAPPKQCSMPAMPLRPRNRDRWARPDKNGDLVAGERAGYLLRYRISGLGWPRRASRQERHEKCTGHAPLAFACAAHEVCEQADLRHSFSVISDGLSEQFGGARRTERVGNVLHGFSTDGAVVFALRSVWSCRERHSTGLKTPGF